MRRRKAFSVLLTALLVFSCVIPAAGFRAEAKGKVSFGQTAAELAKGKIDKKLYNQLEKADKVRFLVKLKDQVNPQQVVKNAEKTAKAKQLTKAKAKLLKRSLLVSELRAKAEETQHDLTAYLQREKKEGKVSSYQSFYIVNALAVTGTKEVLEKLAQFPEVEKILPDEKRKLVGGQAVKKAASTDREAEPKAKTNAIEWNVERVGAPAVWEMGIDGTGSVVASIDTGVQWDHPALKHQYRGYNAQTGEVNHEFNWFDAVDGEVVPYDDIGHGTHVTGTMVGREPNGSNQIGVAPGAKWIAVKAFTESGGYDSDLLEAGEWILAPKDAGGNPHPEKAPDVVNNSWSGGSGMDEWYRPMVQAWRAADIFPEFSAGNANLFNPGGPGSIANPANYPEAFATGATDINNRLASFSLQGPSPYGEIKPEVTAPGVGIRSSVPGGVYEGGWNGTSMAGPHVSAAVALLRQANANLTVDDIEQILIDTATPLTDGTFPQSPNNGYGYGLLNVFDAVSSVVSGLGKVKGQVAAEGEDNEAPAISHTVPEWAFDQTELELTIEATDNVSVTNVFVEYEKPDGTRGTAAAERTSGDHLNGEYLAVVPAEDVRQGTFAYRIHAVDFSGNEAVSEEFSINVLPAITVGYEQDFETDIAGWKSYGTNDVWEWGVPASGPGSAYSGEKVYATSLAGNYPNSANMNLLMPPIQLPEGPSYLQFKQWYQLERGWDYAHVFVSTDKVNWVQKLRITDTSNGWVDGQVDLSEYAGQRIYVIFNLTTDSSVQRLGWYLDDVKISAQPLENSRIKAGLPYSKLAGDKAGLALKSGKVDPDQIKPAKEQKKPEKDGKKPAPAALPLEAQVTVLETGRSVRTKAQDGSYELTHSAGTYTLQAEAYGYRTQTRTVEIPRNGETTANFTLEPLPTGTVTGRVINDFNGEPVAGAKIYLLEDPAVPPAVTDANGEFTLTAYEGDYTLKVVAARFHSEERQIHVQGGEETVQTVHLKPFIGFPGEIGYDDGTAENARAFYDAGNGWAVKMTLRDGYERALLTGGLFRFWDTEWPVPGGTEFQVAVYDASGTDGGPGRKLAGPFDAEALRNGEWTFVDLADHGIEVGKEFFLVYIQSDPYPNSPGLATDEDGPYAGRSWELVGGTWSPSPEDEGNYMIRAVVDYEAAPPVIESPGDGTFTNEQHITVTGTAAPNLTVKLFNNGEEAGETAADASGKFSGTVSLAEGENVLTARVAADNGMTDPSGEVRVVYDPNAPQLTIESPKNKSKHNRETITVEGTVQDENLNWVKVNNKLATVKDGRYSARIMLDEGENVIKVIAQDKAGNRTTKKVTISVDYTAPVLENVKPDRDYRLKAGETVVVEFTSEPGLAAKFVIHMPLTNIQSLANANELPMMEVSPGRYVGYYTATSNVVADGARVEVIATDGFGNESRALASGKLFINVDGE